MGWGVARLMNDSCGSVRAPSAMVSVGRRVD